MVGIDISDRSIKIAEVTDGATAVLQSVCWSPMPTGLIHHGIINNVPSMVDTLRQALQQCSPLPITGKQVVLSIPEMQSFVRVLDLPVMSEGELREAIPWAMRQHIPFDISQMSFDWQTLRSVSPQPGRQSVLVAVVRQAVIELLLQVADALDLHVVALELEAQSIVRSLLPRDAADVTGVLLVDLGATSTNIIFFDQGTIRFSTSIPRGGDDLTQALAYRLHLQPSIAAQKKAAIGVQESAQDAATTATLRVAANDLIKQIQQIVSQVMTQLQAPQGVRAILLAGGAANLPGITNVFAEVFPGVPVQMGNPWVNLMVGTKKNSAPPLSPADASHFTTAIGLALRLPAYAQ